MNSELVLQASHATLAGSLPFPDIVRQLLEAGVEYYHVDYILLQFTFYGANAASVVAPLTFEGLPAVAKDFDAAALRQGCWIVSRTGSSFASSHNGPCEPKCKATLRFCRAHA